MTIVSRLQRSYFLFPLAALAALAILVFSETSYWHSRSEMDNLAELSTARIYVQQLLMSMTDAETAQRGYLLTGRKEYQEPYRNAVETLPDTIKWLRQHYTKNPEHAHLMAKTEELVANRMSELAETMRLYDEGRHEAWHEILLTDIGKERMDAIRTTTEQMLTNEARDGEQARKGVYDALLLNRLGVGIMTLLSLLALFLYLRKTRALDEQQQRQQQTIQIERDRLESEVELRTAELTELSRHLLTAREDERSRLARELHDELGALLTAAKLDTARIKTRIAMLSPELAERLVHLNENLNNVIALKRRIIEDLRPSSLSNLGLIAALEILVREFEQRAELTVVCNLEPVSLFPHTELTVYRLVQEALTNISKYANAKTVRIELGLRDGLAEIAVEDDGLGFDPAVKTISAHGLLGMRYRVEAEDGELTVRSAPGGGTRIAATLPLAPLA
jgi:signal transduction histidine kinase